MGISLSSQFRNIAWRLPAKAESKPQITCNRDLKGK